MAKHSSAHSLPAVPPIQEALGAASAGRLDEAERLYDIILADDPEHFDALHLSGVLRHQQGRSAEALRLVAAALRAQPGSPDVAHQLRHHPRRAEAP